MLSRKIHRYVGLFMLAPLLAWSLTGFIFFIKPGYESAYETLKLKTYPLEQGVAIPSGASWQEAHLVKSILGSHLLVKTDNNSLHLNPQTFEELPMPNPAQLERLFSDTVAQNTERYGGIKSVEGNVAYTTTGIEVELNWLNLTFSQRGRDREIINMFYKIHYLQWTPWPTVNQVLGILGLVLLVTLSGLGIKVYFSYKG